MPRIRWALQALLIDWVINFKKTLIKTLEKEASWGREVATKPEVYSGLGVLDQSLLL